MDLIMDLPRSDGYGFILTIVDQGCFKAAKFIPCNKTIDEPGVANEYLKHLVPWFGIPKQIISYHNPHFASNFSKTLCKNLGVQQNLSMAFHPQMDGQMERMNAWVEQYLRPWTMLRQNNWAKILPIVEYTHNSWKSDTTWKSPHQLLIGISPQVDIKLIDDHTPAAVDCLKALEEARLEVQNHLEQLQQ
jgi:transposase InsO family protein